jgi:peptide/nickel transport system ATP-binding protein
MSEPIFQIRDLHVSFPSEAGTVHAVRGVNLDLQAGEVLGLVGESGSGKSVTSLASVGLLPDSASVRGSITYGGRDLLALRDDQLSEIRGSDISMIFQDPLSALNPVQTIGQQVAEAILIHKDISRDGAWERAIELLDVVGIPNPRSRATGYSFEFSGGMRQRVMIAMAIANEPKVIFADEPTTALDVTVQAQILEALRKARDITGAAVVLVTHDLGVVAGLADRIAIMYAGRIVETGQVQSVYEHPAMPYTIGLLRSIPRIDEGHRRLANIPGSPPAPVETPPGCPFSARCPVATAECESSEPALVQLDSTRHVACHRAAEIDQLVLEGKVFPTETHTQRSATVTSERVLEVSDLRKGFPLMRGAIMRRRIGTVHAVDGVDLRLHQGETLAIVGESGCGKTTTLLQILDMVAPETGSITILGRDVSTLSRRDRLSMRRDMQIVFQDPFASLDPRIPIGEAIAEPLEAFGVDAAARGARVRDLLELVGLNPDHANRYPAEFSGGQRQRIAIARAIALEPKIVALDEPVSALDVSVRAGVLNLLADLQSRLGLSYLFVSHDLAVVRNISDSVAVMYLGGVVESGPVDEIFSNPRHPYTQALLSAVPIPDPRAERNRERIVLEGDLPSPSAPPPGCRFHTRCHIRQMLPEQIQARCVSERPTLTTDSISERAVACHAPLGLTVPSQV